MSQILQFIHIILVKFPPIDVVKGNQTILESRFQVMSQQLITNVPYCYFDLNFMLNVADKSLVFHSDALATCFFGAEAARIWIKDIKNKKNKLKLRIFLF